MAMTQESDRPVKPRIGRDFAELAARYDLADGAAHQLQSLAELLCGDRLAPTALREPRAVLEDHLTDSLVALELECVRTARSAVDIGSGAGLPGIPLAIALPQCSFVLLESSSRKHSFLTRAVEAASVTNAEAAHARAESWEGGLRRFDLAVVRAVGRLDVALEYAAPLLRVGGWAVIWRGQRDHQAEAEAEIAAKALHLRPEQIVQVTPYERVRHRYLHLALKVMETPQGFPRRPGVASKRPLGVR
jgi:16S rRNA (guanine527-N7)-methyltransferase